MNLSFPAGKVRVRITSSDCNEVIACILRHCVKLRDIKMADPLTFTACITGQEYRQLLQISFKCSVKIELIKTYGLKVKRIFKQPVLIFCVLLSAFLTLFVPSRVFFVNVCGNRDHSDKQIKAYANECGIHFGTCRRKISNEKIKNKMLQMDPSLRWIGITANGAVATIEVKEGKSADNPANIPGISSIIAGQDGVIKELTAVKGNVLCHPGEWVKKGKTLISGYTDCGICIKGQQAQGKITAETCHELTALSPDPVMIKDGKSGEARKFSICIGNKIIKLQKSSGFVDGKCVKMYTDYNVKLPGDFLLPIRLICEHIVYYNPAQQVEVGQTPPDWLQSQSESYVKSQMMSGEILRSFTQNSRVPGAYQADCRFSCVENIGRIKSEEIVK